MTWVVLQHFPTYYTIPEIIIVLKELWFRKLIFIIDLIDTGLLSLQFFYFDFPLFVSRALCHIHLIQKTVEFGIYQRLNETVGNYFVSGYIYEIDSTSGYLISDIMILNINVFGSRIKDWVVGKSNQALIVAF